MVGSGVPLNAFSALLKTLERQDANVQRCWFGVPFGFRETSPHHGREDAGKAGLKSGTWFTKCTKDVHKAIVASKSLIHWGSPMVSWWTWAIFLFGSNSCCTLCKGIALNCAGRSC